MLTFICLARAEKAQTKAQTSASVVLDPTKTLQISHDAVDAVNLLGTNEQKDLIKHAFSNTDDHEEEFERMKSEAIAADVPETDDSVMPGWVCLVTFMTAIYR